MLSLIPSANSEEQIAQFSKIQFANLKQLSADDGLSENTINQLYQDKQGFMWLATELGINRYDGHRIKNLVGIQSNLIQKTITHIREDGLGRFWISTENGLSIFDKHLNEIQMSKFPSPIRQQNNANRVVGSIHISEGSGWVVTWNGLYRYDIKNKEIVQPQSMKVFQRDKFNLLAYHPDKNGVWLGTSQGIYFFTHDSRKLTKVATGTNIDNQPIHRIKALNKNSIFLTTTSGFFKLDTPNLAQVTKLNTSQVKVSAEQISPLLVTDFIVSNNTRSDEILYSTADSIYSFQLDDEQSAKLFSLNDVLPNTSTYRIRTLFLDKQDLLWIGTRSRGAYIWNTKSREFRIFNSKSLNKNYRINNDYVWSIDQGNDGDYWIGSNKGVNLIDSKSLKVSTPFDFTQSNGYEKQEAENQAKIYDSYQSNNHLWLATANDLSNLNINTKQIKHYRPRWLKNNDEFIIFSLTSISGDILWLGTNIGTLKFDTHLKLFNYENPNLGKGKDKNKVTRFVSHINGHILIATETDISIYSKTSGVTKLILKSKRNAKGQFHDLTGALYINRQLWLAYSGDGIYIIENNELNTLLSKDKSNNQPLEQNKIIHLDKMSGFPDTSVYSLEFSNDFVWASTNTGLVRIHAKNLTHSIYDSSFGLPNNEFNEGASLLANGHLIYGGTNGLTFIDPNILAPINKTLQTPIITEMKLTQNGRRETLTFPDKLIPGLMLSKNALLSIQITILDFRQSKNWEFEYWFEGKKNLLNKTTKQPEILLTNLKPGHYSLRIKAHSKYYLNESKSIRIEIEVKDDLIFDTQIRLPIFAGVIIIFIIILLFLYRKNRKTKQQLLQTIKDEKRLENALLDKKRGIWELNVVKNTPEKLVVYQGLHSPMELGLERYFEYVHKDDLEKAKKSWLAFLSGENSTISETYRVYFHGELIWNYIHGKVVQKSQDGSPLKYSGIWVNVDEQKKIEEKLHLFSHAFESTLDIVFILDNDLTVVAVNKAYEISTGYICERMIGRSMVDIAFSRFTASETIKIKNKVLQNKRWTGKSSVPRRNSSSFSVDIKIDLISKDGHDNGYVVVMSDLSESDKTRIGSEEFGNQFYDQVTGLPNKVLAFDRLRDIIKNSEENNKSFSLILLAVGKIEQLKIELQDNSLSDLFRHLSARILPYIDREDVLARFDETQFILVLHHKFGDEKIISTINNLIAETIKPYKQNGLNYPISIQAGISKYPDDSTNWSELVTNAQLALEKTAQQNSSHFSYFQESRNQRAIERKEMENKLTKAIQKNELFLVFQPIIDLENHIMLDAEVSFRWQMNKEKIIYPAQILLIAKEIGMLSNITNWMISNTMASLHRWNQEGLSINLNFNLSSDYLMIDNSIKGHTFEDNSIADHSFSGNNFEFITKSLVDNDINPADIMISINEDILFRSNPQVFDNVNQLSDLGIALMLSEFAKTNAPIQKIKTFNFSAIRFDKALIRKIGKDQLSELILENMINMINQLNIKTIASGIEDKKQQAFLTKHQCQLGQGYLYSDPLTENQMRQLMLGKQG